MSKITQEELQAELERLRPTISRNFEMTHAQYEFVKLGREHERPVSWKNLAVMWEKMGWEKVSKYTIRSHYEKRKDV